MIAYEPKINLDTLALWSMSNSRKDATDNKYDLDETGTVPFNLTPASSDFNWNAGIWSSSNYMNAPAAFNTDTAGLTTYTVEGYIYINSLTNGPVFFNFWGGSSADHTSMRFLNTGQARLIVNDISYTSGPSVITTGRWYFWAFTYDGVTLKGYTSPANAISDSTVISTAHGSAGIPASSNTVWFGKYPTLGSFDLNGYLANVRVSNTVKTSFPTTDVKPFLG